MKLPNLLTLNLLTFLHKKQEMCCYLSPLAVEGSLKLSRNDNAYFIKHYNFPADTEQLYTTFGCASEGGIAVTLPTSRLSLPNAGDSASTWSYSFLKKYYIHQITSHFRALEYPVKSNFVDDVEVWIDEKSPYPNCTAYRVYRLRVQFALVTQKPELVVSVGELRSVYKESLVVLASLELSPDVYSWVLYKNNLYRYDDLPDDARRNLDSVYPCLNKYLQRALRIAQPAPDKSNRYLRYWEMMNRFKTQFLTTEQFGDVVELENGEWASVQSHQLKKVSDFNDLLLGGNRVHSDPHAGMKAYGPKALTPHRKTIFFFIYLKGDEKMALTINDFLAGNKTGFSGLNKFVGIPFQTQKGFSIRFENKQNPLVEIVAELNLRKLDSDTRYVAIYLTPHGKWDADEENKAIYYKVKEELLYRGIVSQAIEVEKNWGVGRPLEGDKAKLLDNFKYSLPNIAIALLAKLGGTPWSLSCMDLNELVIGISAFKSESLDKRYLGSAFSFSGQGTFYGFDCFRSNQMSELAGSILMAVKRYRQEHSKLQRLVIHFYKTLSKKELTPIEQGLTQLGLNIPVVVVSMNKTASEDVIGFDCTEVQKMPFSGSYLSIGNSQYLLYNSGLVKGRPYNAREGYPFPLKLSVQYFNSQSALPSPMEAALIPELLQQICQFSQLYWKSVSRQSLPVTLKYPEMLAQIVPHFTRPELPKTGKESLWFL